MKLSRKQRRLILDRLDTMFFGLKARLLGRHFTGPRIFFQVVKDVNPMDTLEGLYRYVLVHTTQSSKTKANEHDVEDLAEIFGNYTDAAKLKFANKIMAEVAAAETPKEAVEAVRENIETATSYVKTLVNAEAQTTVAYANREGIAQIASSQGVADPTVMKLGVIDNKMCESCRGLWHQEGNIRIPKVYKMSELQDGYNTDHKNPVPTVGSTHCNCRHILSYLPDGYGFSAAGQIEFRDFGHDEHAHQRKSK